MKECKKCLIVLEYVEFNKRSDSKDGYSHECRKCSKERAKKHYIKNEKLIKEYQKKYYEFNSDKIKERVKNYRDINYDKIREYDRNRGDDRKEWQKKYHKKRREEDILFRLSGNLRGRIGKFIKNKSKPTKSIIGIEMDDFKSYIESLFTNDMSWDNYGEWDIDHIIPLSFAKNEDELIKLCHYTNLQPLNGIDNIIKSNKIINGTTKKS
jgi:hypothetical protein